MKSPAVLSEQEPQWLLARRLAAQKKHESLALPLYKYGLGITLDFRLCDMSLFEQKDETRVQVEAPSSINKETGDAALKKYEHEIKAWLINEEVNTKFDALHAAEAKQITYINIPDNLQETGQILLTTDLQKTRCENIFVHVGKNSAVVIADTTNGGEENIFQSKRVYLSLEEGANVIYITKQRLGNKTYQLQKKHAKLAKKSSLEWIESNTGGKIVQYITRTELNGQGAIVTSKSLLKGAGEQCFDICAEAIHNAPSTKSNLQTRTIVDGKARAIYRGLIKIQQNATNCEGLQRDDVLILSEDARADTVPNLEISNNDVKCSHSATMTHIDDEKLFYLTSRGISEKKGKELLVEGFAEPFFRAVEKANQQLKNELVSG
ncbi:MAG: Fe-S cluster assembly protein SufD [Nanoarchaeota archaeon]